MTVGTDSTEAPEKDRHASATLRLQRPPLLWARGALRPWEEGVVHVASEAAVRGLNVFEGLKAYRQPDGTLAFVELERHYARLRRSARLLHIPYEQAYAEFQDAVTAISRALDEPDNDLYVRATLLVVEGHYGVGTVSDLVLTAYQQDPSPPAGITVGVSTWRRAADTMMPPRIKTGTNYQVARLARIEGRSRDFADMILLNAEGRVAESTGASVLLVRDGVIATPPPTEGAMESITVDVLARMCETLHVPFERRPIDRTELYVADELALAGTLNEVTPITAIDEYRLPAHRSILDGLADLYRSTVTGRIIHPAVELTPVEG